MTRRDFGTILGGAVMGSMIGCSPARNNQSLEEYIQGQLASTGIPGCCGAICKGDKLIWSGGVGWADMEKKIPMTADTSMNIASVSKTVTAAAVMQLWDAELLQLDDDVSDYLPFPVKNPKHPTVPVTFRQLLTHRSSINDGPSYGVSYSCGDPAVSLHDWISGYFTIDGPYYDPEENFHEWEPGTLNPQGSSRAYSNVGFGLHVLGKRHFRDRLNQIT